MKHSEFKIGTEFELGADIWRCTDIGTRTIIAINLSSHMDDTSWYTGPPYAVAEHTFDEYDIAGCSLLENNNA